jgi:polar amino acid transport system substrate-binding protein
MTRKLLGNFCGVAALMLAVTANAKEIHMVAPIIPPHFDEQGKGRIGDVIKAALAKCGYQLRFTMVPFGRHWKEYRDSSDLDALATAEADQTFPGFSTLPFMNLQDGATVMATKGLQGIGSVAELQGKHVVAFPDARQILGIDGDVAAFASYAERSNRFDQLRPLFTDRVDAILADGLITAHFIGVLKDNARAGKEPGIDPSRQPVFRKIFQQGPQRLYFRDAAVTKEFDRCFMQVQTEGEVERLAKPYIERYRSIVGDQYPLH